MEKSRIRENLKKENGSITLFVLLAMLFFLIVVISVNVYLTNKTTTESTQLQDIKNSYESDLEHIDEIYEEIISNERKEVEVGLTADPNSEYTKKVILTGTATIPADEGESGGEGTEENEIELEYYAFGEGSIDNLTENNITWKPVSNTETKDLTKTQEVTENGTYYFVVKDSDGNITGKDIEVNNIDNINPTVGTIIAKEVDEEGNETDYDYNTTTDNSVKVELVDGTDNESGHKSTTMTIRRNGNVVDEWINIEGPITLTQSGTYTIVITTTDNVGNTSVSETYYIKIDKVVPILALQYEDENGDEYDGEWTNKDLYGEITIDSASSGQEVQKYQYSYDNANWYDVSEEKYIADLDYTSTFPLSGTDKPSWISGPVNNGTYYFEQNDDGTIVSNNVGNANTSANSYFEIDLTDFPDETLTLTLNATVLSRSSSYGIGYATITETETAPAYNSTSGRFIYAYGYTAGAKDYTTTLTGGKKYYLHIGYQIRTNSTSTTTYKNTFTINSITLQGEGLVKGIEFYNYAKQDSTVTFNLQDEIDKTIYIRAVYDEETNSYSKTSDTQTIKIDKTAPVIESTETSLQSATEAKADITITEKASGVKGYYITTDGEITPNEATQWTETSDTELEITGLTANTTYYIWVIDNAGNISERQEIVTQNANYVVDDTIYVETLAEAISVASSGSNIKLLNDYTDTSTATMDKNLTFDVQSYTLTRNATITINSGCTVEITGTGKITTGTSSVRTITNNGTLTLSNSITIENRATSSSYAPIYTNNSSSVTNINDNVTLSGYYYGIRNYNGTVNVNGGLVESTYSNSSAYGIYNRANSSVKTYIYGGEITGYNGIYNENNATLEMSGGTVTGTNAYGIYAYGTTNVYGGRVEGATYGVYVSATNKLTIGNSGQELSTTIPAIKGNTYGIYVNNSSYGFYFYNGVIITPTKSTVYNQGVLNPREGYIPYTYYDNDVEKNYCTILAQSVENITIEQTPTEYTNQDVTVTITYPYDSTSIRQYSEDGKTWVDAEDYVQEVRVSENKTIYARTLDSSEIITEEAQHEVTNIDKIPPVATVTPSQTTYIVTDENATVDITATINASDEGVSGINVMQYAWAKEGEEPEYIDFENEITINKTKLKIGTYNLYINVTDNAGNRSDVTQIRYTVKYQQPVAQIGDTTYLTIQDAVDACSKEAGDEQTTIIILTDTDEEFTVYEGQNIILDLKGYTVGSSSTDTAICTNNGKLQIVDSSANGTGGLESLNGTAIVNNGTLTHGNSEDEIDFDTPTIYGKKIGIDNNNVFNYYDGQIKSTNPIDGSITDSPDSYGPVSVDYTDGITTIQLGIILDEYVARIDWIYYTSLQGAIDATRVNVTDDDRDTVTIVKDIQLSSAANVAGVRNMILDLNGHTITVNSSLDRVINNSGNLKITDSSADESGEITIYSSNAGTYNTQKGTYGIYNNESGNIEIAGGMIECSTNASYNYAYGIYNASSGKVEISEGTVNANNSSAYHAYGIYNYSTGSVEVSGGTISSNNTYSSGNNSNAVAYGICNYSTGNIEVGGGTVSSSSSSYYAYGIYNISIGSIEVHGGTISSKGTSSISVFSYSYGIYNYGAGNIEISVGTVSNNTYGIYNYGMGNIEVSGGTVSNNTYGIYNYGMGNIEVSGGTVSNNTYGIYNYGAGNIEVSGGTVSNSSNRETYGIYNESTGTITIGTKGDKLVYKETPSILAESKVSYAIGYGIYNLVGDIYFYDGIIQGDIAYVGTITEIEDGYKIENSEIDGYDSIYLVPKSEAKYVVQIDDNKYYTLNEAIESITTDTQTTIKVISDFELYEGVEFNKNIILDLNGYTIINNFYKISNTGNLEIIDSSINKDGLIKSNQTGIGIINYDTGKIEIIEGELDITGIGIATYGIYNVNTGNVIVIGGIISVSASGNWNSAYGIYNNSTGIVEVKGGTINNTSTNTSDNNYAYGIYNKSTGIVKISWGLVTTNSSNDAYGIYNNSTGTVEISGGTISSNCSGYTYGIYNPNSGNTIINGGEINCTGDVTYGVYYGNSGSLTMNGGSISSSSFGVYNNLSARITITKGTISSNGSRYTYGIYNRSTGTITLGTKGDGLVSEEEPSITAEYTGTSSSYKGYGINNTKGKLYFYDGIIQGTTLAIYDTITEIEDDTILNYNEDETVVTLSSELKDVAQVGNQTFTSLQEAIDTVGSTKTTVTLLRNVAYTNKDNAITITNGQNVVLDLNGYKISSAILGKLLQNEGTLEITDSSQDKTGTLVTAEETTINNAQGATLTISGGTIENRTKQSIYNEGTTIIAGGTLNGTDYGIYNTDTGTVTVSGGEISDSPYGVYNSGAGSVSVTGGTTGGTRCGIYNASTGNITVTGGTVTGTSSNSSNAYGIYNASTGTITIGTKGDGVISKESPSIIGKTYGVYTESGNIYYYDGVIQGKTRAVNTLKEIEDNVQIIVSSDSDYDVITLEPATANTVTSNGTQYTSIYDPVVNAGTAETTIQLISDVHMVEQVVVASDQNITIDLNGHTLNTYFTMQNNGTLKITDSSVEKTGKISSISGTGIQNTGTLEMLGGTISDTGYAIENAGTLTFDGATLSNNTYGIYNSGGNATIKSGTISSNTYGVYNNSGTTTVDGGTISSNTYGIYIANGTVDVNSGDISSNDYGAYNSNGTLNIYGTGITENDYGIYNAGGTTNIKEGAEVSSDTAVYNSSGNVYIGEQGSVNPDSPLLIGEKYGLEVLSNANIYFYDGQIRGKSASTLGFITYTETGYSAATTTEGEYFVDYLELTGTVETVAEANGIGFSNLQSAFNAASTDGEQVTVKLTNGISSSTTYTIAEGQNIILDMNGKTITSDQEITIDNAGTLTIIDSSGMNVGKISSTTGVAINNTGTLTLGTDDGTMNEDLIVADGQTYGIVTTGTLNFYDGKIMGGSALSGTITSRASGYVIRTTTVDSKECYYLTT